MPSGRVITADTMIRFQPQKVNQAILLLHSRVRAGPLHAVEGCGHQHAAAEGEDHRIGVERAQTPEGEVRTSKFRTGQASSEAM